MHLIQNRENFRGLVIGRLSKNEIIRKTLEPILVLFLVITKFLDR